MPENCFGVHIFTMMKSLDILKSHDIPWVQEKSEPVAVFCWCWNFKQRRKDIGELFIYPIACLGIYLK